MVIVCVLSTQVVPLEIVQVKAESEPLCSSVMVQVPDPTPSGNLTLRVAIVPPMAIGVGCIVEVVLAIVADCVNPANQVAFVNPAVDPDAAKIGVTIA